MNDKDEPLGCPKINNYLRYGVGETYDILRNIWLIDNALSKSIAKTDIHIFRGVNLTRNISYSIDLLKHKAGDIIIDKGYFSTTYIPFVAMEFADPNSGPYALFDINLKAGQHCYPLYEKSSKKEYEILLPRNSKLKITKRKTVKLNGKTIAVFFMELL